MIESITFNTAESNLIVTLEDGTSTEYTDSAAYIADYPDRYADAIAMGWEMPDGWTPPEPEIIETPEEQL